MRIVKCSSPEADRAKYGPGFVYCGRAFGLYQQASVLANRHTTHGTCKVCNVRHSVEESVECFRGDLWYDLKWEEPEVLAFLEQLDENSILGCWCVSTYDAEACTSCHCGVIARAWHWWRKQQRPTQ